MNNDDNNNGPGGPYEPGEAISDSFGPIQRNVNETESPVKNVFEVRGYTINSIEKYMTDAGNKITYENIYNYNLMLSFIQSNKFKCQQGNKGGNPHL